MKILYFSFPIPSKTFGKKAKGMMAALLYFIDKWKKSYYSSSVVAHESIQNSIAKLILLVLLDRGRNNK